MKRVISLLLLSFVVSAASAQSVGLVLSGGGAKGLYHIGIIKALEENNIPVDYVAGTSMGSIVAGLYAIGYSPWEMEELFLSDMINLWLSGKIEPKYHFYFKRMVPNQAMLTLNLDFKSDKGVAQIPVNVLPSTQLDLSFNEIFGSAAAKAKGNFDDLFVPFRCIAADVYNKKEVVFREGSVGYAIRASMSIPLAFPPMKADTVLLYDGGIYNNFPWQVVDEDFKPDVIIGGKCVKGVQNPDPNSLSEQIEAIMMMHTDYNLPEDKGIMIERVFDDVGMLDFSRAQYIIDMGYKDAMEKIDEIKERIPRRQSDAELFNRRLAYKSELPELIFNDYQISGINSNQKIYVENHLGIDRKGGRKEEFSFQDFKSEYFKILSEGDIVADFPSFNYNDTTGYFSAGLNLATKPSFRIKLGGNISSTSLNQAYVGVEYKVIGRNAYSARFDGNYSAYYTSVKLGGRSDVHIGKPLYYDFYMNFNTYNYTKSNYKTLFRSYGFNEADDFYLSFSTGMPTGRSSVFKIRTNIGRNYYKYFEAPSFTDNNYTDKTKFTYWSTKAEIVKNTLNYSLYPTRGILQRVSVIHVTGRERFTAGDIYPEDIAESREHHAWFGAKYMRQAYWPVSKWLTFGYHIEGVYTNQPSFSNYHSTMLVSPEFTPTIQSKAVFIDKFRADKYVAGGVIPVFHFMPSFYMKNAVYLYQPRENKDFERTSDRMRYMLNSSLVYQTPIGPASLTFATFDAGRKNWYVVFNFGYTIFNSKGLYY